MSQSFEMDRAALAKLSPEFMERFQRVDLAGQTARLTEIVAGQTSRAVYERMDETQHQIAEHGGVLTHRTRIGRNTSCPCGSGRKYKKCCIGRTPIVG